MHTISRSLFIGAVLAAACAPQKPVVLHPPLAMPKEVRALWVVRNTLDHPDSIRAMVARAHESGFNTLIVQVRGRGDAFYNSRWEPRATSIVKDPKFDPLALTIEEAHRQGIAVHAWLNTNFLANMDNLPTDPRHMYQLRPDLIAVPYKLARELYAVDPRDPWMDVLEHYDVDGINFDYVRYPGPDYDYSRISLDRFRLWLVPQLPDSTRARFAAMESDPLVYADSFPSRYNDFRRAQVTELVERIYYGVKKRNPNVIVSADVFANAKDAYENRFQDWPTWLRRGFLDVAALMAYSTNTQVFRDQIKMAVEAGGRDRV